MVGWHHRLKGHEFEQAPGDSEGQGSLVCCSPWGCRTRHNLAPECNVYCTLENAVVNPTSVLWLFQTHLMRI